MSEQAQRRRDDVVGLDALFSFDAILDARSPGEYVLDHVPGSVNLPVLDDAERARVGTLYKRESPFAARRVGAALVSRNIARHLESHCAERPRTWRPLVYCWRGGNRSGAFVTVLRAVGWRAAQLEGGYKAFRRHVLAELQTLPETFDWRVLCGATGVGKSRLLHALAQEGAQVLDLEELAAHRGSVLGARPDHAQPAQRLFETRIWQRLRSLDPARPVFVESESRKIGTLHTPEVLLACMRAATCIELRADTPTRVALLRDEYAHFLDDPETLTRQLDCLIALRGHARVAAWKALARAGRWDELIAELLHEHYDPSYRRSLEHDYIGLQQAPCLRAESPDIDEYRRLARTLLAPPLDGQTPPARLKSSHE
jgi:tRNA 2-selenouridine synthase